MPANPVLSSVPQVRLLGELGERLRKARLRRKLSATAVAAAAGISRITLHRAERGEPAITVGTLMKIMSALDLAADIALLARDDIAGRLLQDAALAPRRTTNTAPLNPIRLDRYPQLQQIAWHLGAHTRELTPQEAYALYERQWRHVDAAAMPPREKVLIKRLIASVGHGVLLV